MNPMPPAAIKALRASLGVSQQHFCLRYGIAVATLQSWEQGRRTPDATATVLLALIALRPLQMAVMIALLTKEQP